LGGFTLHTDSDEGSYPKGCFCAEFDERPHGYPFSIWPHLLRREEYISWITFTCVTTNYVHNIDTCRMSIILQGRESETSVDARSALHVPLYYQASPGLLTLSRVTLSSCYSFPMCGGAMSVNRIAGAMSLGSIH
jgi:hypothetical protein